MSVFGFSNLPPTGNSYGTQSFGAPTGAGGGGAGNLASKQNQQSRNWQYFQNPSLVNALSGSVGGVAQGASQNYLNFVNNPTQHPYFSNALGGLLNALIPSEQNARMSLADTFRAAGNTASSTYGSKAMGLESELMRNRGSVASNLLTTMFPQISQALFAPMGQASSLINALKMSEGTSKSSGESYHNPNSGGGGGSISYGPSALGGMNIFSTPNFNTAAPGQHILQGTNPFNAGPQISPIGDFNWGSMGNLPGSGWGLN